MNIKVEFAPRAKFLELDSAKGSFWHEFSVVFSVPNSPQAIIAFPDLWLAGEIAAYMEDAIKRGEVIDWRFEHDDYQAFGWEDIQPWAVGDTFQMHGVTADVRKRGKDGEGVMVNVADTGVDSTHAMFTGVTVIGTGKDKDGHGHGTHCASTAGGLSGVAPNAVIYAGKALNDRGGGTESGVANAIRVGVDAGAKVVSLSLGGSVSQVIDSACEYAKDKGAVVVVAAGNGGGAPIGSPARAADLIVMAHDRNDSWAPFTDGRDWTNPNRIGANGVAIEAAKANSGSGTVIYSGTSMACPHVAGFVALLLAGGKDRQSAVSYILASHVLPPDGPGKAFLKADFGEIEPPAPPTQPPGITWYQVGFRNDGTVVWRPAETD